MSELEHNMKRIDLEEVQDNFEKNLMPAPGFRSRPRGLGGLHCQFNGRDRGLTRPVVKAVKYVVLFNPKN